MKHFRESPVFISIFISMVVLSAVGWLGRDTVYQGFEVNVASTPMLSAVFQGLKESVYPWEIIRGYGRDVQPALSLAGEDGDSQDPGSHQAEPQNTGEQTHVIGAGNEKVTIGAGADQIDGQPTVDPDPETLYEFQSVTEDYFKDALFIGDSRTDGLKEYARMPEETTFYAQASLTVYDILEKEIVKVADDRKKITIEEALQENSFAKIYLMVGINELGRGTVDTFVKEYEEVVGRIRQLQPQAIIFIQGIMRVAGEKSSTDPIFNNTNINQRNNAISMLADNHTIFYLDCNAALSDENGDLTESYTYDLIHLKASYYQLWKQYLLENGIVRE